MFTLSATCLAIALASESGALRLVEREGRFGSYVSIEDAVGIIEVADNMSEANARIAAILERIA